jgi:hypothetical protein
MAPGLQILNKIKCGKMYGVHPIRTSHINFVYYSTHAPSTLGIMDTVLNHISVSSVDVGTGQDEKEFTNETQH